MLAAAVGLSAVAARHPSVYDAGLALLPGCTA
jgi:hypothetical protein